MVSDRFIFTLLISVIIYLIILLGISFDVFSPPTNAPVNHLEITLVKQRDNVEPEQADFLAQADNEGGGVEETPTPNPSPEAPLPIAEKAAQPAPIEPPVPPAPIEQPTPLQPAPTPPQPRPEPEPVKPEPKPEPPKPKPAAPKQAVKKITTAEAERKVSEVKTPEPTPEKTVEETPPPKLSARELMMQARTDAHMLRERLAELSREQSSRPKREYLTASTKKYEAAAYLKAWELKIERIGNMNYPLEAKKKGLTGSLRLSVDINPDGSVPPGGIVVSKSSGSQVLDDAAKHIVRLGAPYARVPKDVLAGNDMLTIIRTWKFETGNSLSTR
jgi:protein TonB